jgi:hypothetical protein
MNVLRFALALCALLGFTLIPVGCDDGCECCDYPRRANDWYVEIIIGAIPDPVPGYPFDLRVIVEVWNAETGGRAPDGLIVDMSITPGSFVEGGAEIQVPLTSGRATAFVRIAEPGSYELSVRPDSDSQSVRTTFQIGL